MPSLLSGGLAGAPVEPTPSITDVLSQRRCQPNCAAEVRKTPRERLRSSFQSSARRERGRRGTGFGSPVPVARESLNRCGSAERSEDGGRKRNKKRQSLPSAVSLRGDEERLFDSLPADVLRRGEPLTQSDQWPSGLALIQRTRRHVGVSTARASTFFFFPVRAGRDALACFARLNPAA